MKTLLINSCLLLFLFPAVIHAQPYNPNIVDGEILFKESCIRCHGETLAEYSAIITTKKLKDKIRGCVYHLDLPWHDSDIADTAHYLDKKYFNFEEWD